MNAEWFLVDGVNHAVYTGDGPYTEFYCGKDSMTQLEARDTSKPMCLECLRCIEESNWNGSN